MHKFFVNQSDISGDNVHIVNDDVKHIYKVLRLNAGDLVNINNSNGSEYIAKITEITKTYVNLKLIEKTEVNNESSIVVHLYQGLPKSAKMDLIVQKCTELGVRSITPILTERVVVRTELSLFSKTDRWKRIALESSKQSKRSIIPDVNKPIEFNQMIQNIKDYDLVVVPYENEEGTGIKTVVRNIESKVIKTVAIVIGPEGGFAEGEIKELNDKGVYIVTLGPRILRTETAGFVTLSILLYELGDMGGEQ